MSVYKMNLPKEMIFIVSGTAILMVGLMILFLISSKTSDVLLPNILTACFAAMWILFMAAIFYRAERVTYELDQEGLKISSFDTYSFLYSEIESFRKISSADAMTLNTAYPVSQKYVLKPAKGFEMWFNPEPILIETSQQRMLLGMTRKISLLVNPKDKEQFLSELKSRVPSSNKTAAK
jgi:hypothetical protein